MYLAGELNFNHHIKEKIFKAMRGIREITKTYILEISFIEINIFP